MGVCVTWGVTEAVPTVETLLGVGEEGLPPVLAEAAVVFDQMSYFDIGHCHFYLKKKLLRLPWGLVARLRGHFENLLG